MWKFRKNEKDSTEGKGAAGAEEKREEKPASAENGREGRAALQYPSFCWRQCSAEFFSGRIMSKRHVPLVLLPTGSEPPRWSGEP